LISSSMNRPLLLGHRGVRGLKSIPENTFSAFDRALADGCDGFEFDVRRAADGTPVLCHDPRVGEIVIAEASVAELGPMPRLADVLVRYHERAFLDLELKVVGLEKIAATLFRENLPRRGFVVSSFLPEALHAVHAEDSSVPLGLICETHTQLRDWRKLPIDYVIPHYGLVDCTLLAGIKDARKKVLVWTVNSTAEMRNWAQMGVDGIISDHTRLLCQTLSGLD